ncbi:MAG TPA: hypothetical protein VK002_14820 [Rubricoccaceae bacterium]|nr:hypothetical protein [Rubricoccaceae bacterium]
MRTPASLLLLLPLLLPVVSGCDQHEDIVVIGNDIIVRTFSVSGDDLTISNDNLVGSYHREVPEMTADVVDDGAVLLYADGSLLLSGGGGTWTALPFSIGVDEDGDLFVDYTVSFTYSYDLQDLYIDVVASDTIYPFEDLPRTEYKLVLIPGDLFVSSAKSGLDYSDYEAVRQAYGLVE